MFIGPFDQQIAWSTAGLSGTRRFIEKVWKLQDKISNNIDQNQSKEISKFIHKAIKKVTDDINSLRFNTAISTLMITVNEIEKVGAIDKENFSILIKLLAPFAPHFTEELWTSLGNKKSIHIAPWPVYKPEFVQEDIVNITIQINGKLRGSFEAPSNADKSTIEKIAMENDVVKKWLEGKKVTKVIVVPNRLINIVVSV